MSRETTGFVALVGAGPYDKGLITVKGMEEIRRADCILYDRLINPAFLFEAREGCEKIDVGKEQANHKLKQHEINGLILEKALEGKRVVRLKGGDPYLFGRGAEELKLLSENKIPYEVVPGITSAIAAPAYAGIPVTHRDYSSSLHIITGHYREGKAFDIDFEALTKLGGTLVFLMGLENLQAIVSGLTQAGMPADFPAAIIESGTSSKQRSFAGTVNELKTIAEQNNIKSPAAVVIGKVAALSKEFDWFSQKPLSGMRILVACHENSTQKLVDLIYQKGGDGLPYPCAGVTPVRFNLPNFSDYTWLVFTSRQGVKFFFRELMERRLDVRNLCGLKIAVVGPETERELNSLGFMADYLPENFDGESLAMGLPVDGSDKVLLAQAAEPSGGLSEKLKERGISFTELTVYETRLIKREPSDLAGIDCVAFTSASNVKGFALSTGEENIKGLKAVCIGRQTALAAESFGMKTYTAKNSTFEGMIDLCCELNPRRRGNRRQV